MNADLNALKPGVLDSKTRVNIYSLKLIFPLPSSTSQNERSTKRECSTQTLFGVLTKTCERNDSVFMI